MVTGALSLVMMLRLCLGMAGRGRKSELAGAGKLL
jgi:hypothetical protein